jgi:hypothetical protein
MGLFWSMEPAAEPKSADHAFFARSDWLQPIVTEIEAKLGDAVLVSVMIERRFARPGVQRTPIGEGGIVGLLYDPGDRRQHPGVVVIGGPSAPTRCYVRTTRGWFLWMRP